MAGEEVAVLFRVLSDLSSPTLLGLDDVHEGDFATPFPKKIFFFFFPNFFSFSFSSFKVVLRLIQDLLHNSTT